MSHEQAVLTIESVLEKLRPGFQGDGGDVELIRYEDHIVYVKLHGACAHCPISMVTIKFGIEDALKSEIPELKEVIAVE